jgi:hypothetical protein
MCEASRPQGFGAGYHVTECSTAEHAFCATSHHAVLCASTEEACQQITDFDAHVLRGAHDGNTTACAAR